MKRLYILYEGANFVNIVLNPCLQNVGVIAMAIPDYSKVSGGIDLAEQISIDKISRKRRHFANWLTKLTAWSKEDV
ncbi:MAG: DUF4276 family protein [Defluviitaleaceae bacterium]|nr:DUF4276 family protein [Defluviitaleaceae bacterium]